MALSHPSLWGGQTKERDMILMDKGSYERLEAFLPQEWREKIKVINSSKKVFVWEPYHNQVKTPRSRKIKYGR